MERAVRKVDVFDRSWQDQANCLGVDPDLFFPERGASTREAVVNCTPLCQLNERIHNWIAVRPWRAHK